MHFLSLSSVHSLLISPYQCISFSSIHSRFISPYQCILPLSCIHPLFLCRGECGGGWGAGGGGRGVVLSVGVVVLCVAVWPCVPRVSLSGVSQALPLLC